MADLASRRQSSTTLPVQKKSSIIDDLFDMAASRELDVMLGKALRMTIRLLGAEAGSVLFQGQAPVNMRSGSFRHEALVRIQRWEDVIRKRLQESTWNIASSSELPVSVSKLNTQLVLINVPLVQGVKVVGSLSFVLPPGGNLDDNQKNLLKRLAIGLGQIASLIAELETANHRLHQISIFYEVGQALVTTFDIAQLLAEAMELATNVIDAGAASILLVDEEKQELVFKVSHGAKGHTLRQQRIPLDQGIAGWVVRKGQPVIANDARADARFSHRVDVRTGFLTQSIAAVPLKIKGRIIGVLEVLNKYSGTGFNHEDIQLMNSIAAQAAIAIENARLYEELRAELDHLVFAEDDFRREVRRKLQNGPRQLLSDLSTRLEQITVNTNPDAVQTGISAARELVEQAGQAIHKLMFDLRPKVLETQGLAVALEQHIEKLRITESFNIEFRTVDDIRCDEKTANAIFFVIQESLKNIRRHAQASMVWLSLDVRSEHFIVTIRDNGQGFNVETAGNRLAFGIPAMQQQADSIGAKFQINSSTQEANRGTIVQLILNWPLE